MDGQRANRNGWAQGEYFGTCIKCKKEFIGDKRAIECEVCAYSYEPLPPKKTTYHSLVDNKKITEWMDTIQSLTTQLDKSNEIIDQLRKDKAQTKDALIDFLNDCHKAGYFTGEEKRQLVDKLSPTDKGVE